MKVVSRAIAVTITILLTPILVLSITAGTAQADSPLFRETFEQTNGSLPTGWQTSVFAAGISTFDVASGDAYEGQHYLRIKSPAENHARVEVTVPVTWNTNYHWHAMARSNGVIAGRAAAVLGLDSNVGVSNSASTTTWQPVDLYVAVGKATTMSVVLGLGNFGQTNTGEADFDDVTLDQVDVIPPGAVTDSLSPPPEPQSASQLKLISSPSDLAYILAGLLGLAVVAIAWRLYRAVDGSPALAEQLPPRSPISELFGFDLITAVNGDVVMTWVPASSALDADGFVSRGSFCAFLDVVASHVIRTSTEAEVVDEQMTVGYLSPVRGVPTELTARGWTAATEGSRRVVEAEVRDGSGGVVARASTASLIL